MIQTIFTSPSTAAAGRERASETAIEIVSILAMIILIDFRLILQTLDPGLERVNQ